MGGARREIKLLLQPPYVGRQANPGFPHETYFSSHIYIYSSELHNCRRTSSCHMPALKLGAIHLLQTFVLVETIRQICWFDKVSTITLVKRCLHVQANRELVCIPLIYYI